MLKCNSNKDTKKIKKIQIQAEDILSVKKPHFHPVKKNYIFLHSVSRNNKKSLKIKKKKLPKIFIVTVIVLNQITLLGADD